MNKASKVPDNNVIPWMPKPIRDQLKARREDPKFKERSERHKKNKFDGSERAGNTIKGGHHQGSISSIELGERLMKENKDRMPSAADLYVR